MTYAVHIQLGEDGRPIAIIPDDQAPAGPGDITVNFDDNPPEGNYSAEEAKAAAKVVLDQLKDALSRIRSVKIKPGLKSVYRDPAVGWLLMVFGALLFILFVPCAIYLYFHHNDRPVFSFVLAALWTVAVPIYFFLEHELFFFYLGDAAEYERFTRVQDLAAKIWSSWRPALSFQTQQNSDRSSLPRCLLLLFV